jgi:hypothetical protein
MTIKRTLFEKGSDLLIAILGLNWPSRIYLVFLSRINCIKQVKANGTDILFDANEELHLLRYEWINGFEKERVLYGVKANIWAFSLEPVLLAT